MAEVILENVVKRFGKTQVVHGIDLRIENLEFIVFVGPSGCGKSTTLRMIAGLEKISEGIIRIGGRIINDVAPKDRDVAMVFQNYALYPHMNVFNNMAFGLKLRKIPKAEIKKRVGEAARILGLEELLKRKPYELSGGQRQRVAMGRAIVRDPSVFLFDEPLSNLDAKLRNQMRGEIKRLHRKVKATIIYVTHDQVEAMTLADRIVVMRDGYLEQVGKPLDLFQNPANVFVAGFIGNPPMNLNQGQLISDGDKLKIEFEGGLKIPVPRKPASDLNKNINKKAKVIMGLRPENLVVDNGNGGFPDEWKVEGLVEFVEPLGSETYLHLDINGIKFIGKSDGHKLFSIGDKLKMAMDLNHLHIFDKESALSVY